MRKIILVLGMVLFVHIAHAQTFIQPCVSDARLSYNDGCTTWQTTNYGTSTTYQAATWTWVGIGCSGGDIRFIQQFDINPATSPQALYDNRATLNLYFPPGSAETHFYTGSGTDNQFYIQHVTANWTENTVTWNTQPASTTVGQILVPSASTNPSTQDYTIDVSTLVYEWVCGTTPNYGFKMQLLNEGQTYRRVTFCSREYADPGKHPTLTMEYAYIAATGPDTICEGDVFNVNCALNNANNPANYSYQWEHTNSGSTYATQNLNSPNVVLGLNTYVVTVSNPWCQTAKDTVQVFVQAQPTANAGTDTSICSGQSVQLTATGGSSYAWSNGGNTASINVSPTLTTTYTVTVSNGNCSATDDVIVTVSAMPNANAGNDTTICENDQANLVASGGGTYLWSNGVTTANNTVSPLITTTYTVTVDNNGCTASDDVVVTVDQNFDATITAAGPFCRNDIPFILTAVDTGGLWSGTGVNATTGSFDPSLAGVGTHQIIYTVSGNCGDADTLNILVNDLPQAIVVGDTICNGDQASISVSGGSSYLWSNGSTNANVQISPTQTTTYYVIVTDTNTCEVVDSALVVVNDIPQISLQKTDAHCGQSDGSVLANVSGGNGVYSYEWSPSGATTSQINNVPAGNYSVTVTTQGCSNTASIVVADIAGPQAMFTSSTMVAEVDQLIYFYDNSIGATSWFWQFGDGNTSAIQDPTHTYSVPGLYTVTLTVEDDFSCRDSISQDILINNVFVIHIPNSFTPNGDGINDVFKPIGIRIDEDRYLMQVFDRWGKKVFETTDFNEGWDGTVNGKAISEKDLMTAVFVYYIYVVEQDAEADHEYRGAIHLIR